MQQKESPALASLEKMFTGVVVERDFDSFDGLTSYDIPRSVWERKRKKFLAEDNNTEQGFTFFESEG